MENTFLDIEERAELLSISGASFSSTVRGLGTLSGKGIMAVGDLVIRVLDYVSTRLRLRSIAAHVKNETAMFSPSAFENLFELQRIGIYPKSTTNKAWSLILKLLDRGNPQMITDVLLSCPTIEIELFVRQLAAYKLSNWSTPEVHYTPTPRLSINICILLDILLDEQHVLLHSLFDIQDFLSLCREEMTSNHPTPQTNATAEYWWLSLTSSNTNLSPHNHVSLALLCMVKFLATGPRSDLEDTVRSITRSLNDLHKDTTLLDPSNETLKMTVLFTEYLYEATDDAIALLIEAGIMETLAAVCESALSSAGTTHPQRVSTFLQLISSLLTRMLTDFWDQVSHSMSHLQAFADLCPLLLGQIIPDTNKTSNQNLRQLVVDHLLMLVADRYANNIDNVGLKAWSVFVSLFSSSEASDFAEHLTRQPCEYALQILRTLNQYRCYDWSGDTIMLQAVPHWMRPHMHVKFRDLVMEVVTVLPEIVTSLFTVQEFVFLLTQEEDVCPAYIPHFFAHLVSSSTDRNNQQLEHAPHVPSTVAFVQYLSGATLMDREFVADCIFRLLRVASNTNEHIEPPSAQPPCAHAPKMYGDKGSILVLLNFAKHLAIDSLDVSRFFIQNGLIDVLKSIWLTTDDERITTPQRDALSTAVVVMFGALTYYEEVEQSLVDYGVYVWLKFNLAAPSLADESPSRTLEHPQVQILLISMLRYYLLNTQGVDNEYPHWMSILYVLSKPDPDKYGSLGKEAAHILLCGCLTPERWKHIAMALGSCPYNRLHPALRTVVEHVKNITLVCSHALALHKYATQLQKSYEYRGNKKEKDHPIHCFIRMMLLTIKEHRHVATAFFDAGMIRILDAVMSGEYDFFGPLVVSMELYVKAKEILTNVARGSTMSISTQEQATSQFTTQLFFGGLANLKADRMDKHKYIFLEYRTNGHSSYATKKQSGFGCGI